MAFTDSAEDTGTDTTTIAPAGTDEGGGTAATPPATPAAPPAAKPDAPAAPAAPEPKQPDLPDFLKGGGEFIGGLLGEAIRSIRPPPDRPSEPYIPARMRQPSEWGKPDHHLRFARMRGGPAPGPYMPQGSDVNRLLARGTAFLARLGSPTVAGLAQNVGVHNDRWMRDYMAGREAALRMQDNEMKRNMGELELKQGQESEEYGVAFGTYKGERLRQELFKIANKHGDTAMLELLNKNDLDGAQQLNAQRDHHLLSLMKYTAQRDAMSKKDAKDAEEARSDAKFFSTTPPTPATPPTAAAPAAATAPGSETPSEGTPPAAGPSLPSAAPNVDKAAQKLQVGSKPADAGVATQRQLDAAQARKDQLDDYMRGIIADKTMTPDQVKAAIRRGNPAMADEVDAMLEAGAMPTMAGSMTESTRMALNLARRVDPNFTRTAQAQKDREALIARRREEAEKLASERTKLSAYRTDLARNLTALSNLRTTIPRNLKDMEYLTQLAGKVDKTGVPVVERWIRAGRTALAGDADVTEFNTQVEEFRRDVAGITRTMGGSGSGVYTVNAQKSMENFIPAGTTPSMMKGMAKALRRDYENLLIPQVGEVNRLQEQMFGAGNFKREDGEDILKQIRESREGALSEKDKAAAKWAHEHPDDPRAKQILDKLGM
jgi:hypothetical protein